jgi:hypothetical protein
VQQAVQQAVHQAVQQAVQHSSWYAVLHSLAVHNTCLLHHISCATGCEQCNRLCNRLCNIPAGMAVLHSQHLQLHYISCATHNTCLLHYISCATGSATGCATVAVQQWLCNSGCATVAVQQAVHQAVQQAVQHFSWYAVLHSLAVHNTCLLHHISCATGSATFQLVWLYYIHNTC